MFLSVKQYILTSTTHSLQGIESAMFFINYIAFKTKKPQFIGTAV